MKISKHIYLDKSFAVFLILIILTGSFNLFFGYFLLLLVHEFGHSIMGVIYGYQLEKIALYPYGGITIFNLPLNIPLKKELHILLAGPLFQIIGYFLLSIFFHNITIYHYTLLIFNLLPIYPLDGGRILSNLLGYHFNYLKVFYLTFILSLIFFILSVIYFVLYLNINAIITLLIIVIKLISYFKKRKLYYNRFLLEKHLKEYPFKKISFIKEDDIFFRDSFHYVNFTSENIFLEKKYTKK